MAGAQVGEGVFTIDSGNWMVCVDEFGRGGYQKLLEEKGSRVHFLQGTLFYSTRILTFRIGVFFISSVAFSSRL